jgi:DNA polymerase-3 subunit gamma/tau
VDNIRELIENSQYRPARSRFKIYVIDEVHMLSKSAFNALLKTLEEPPSHVKFILATTEPEKVLPTILSRCQRYDFRNIPTAEIAGHLMEICKKEKIQASEDALLLVAKAGAGSMRDALSLLDRLLSVGEKKLSVELIEQMLGLPRSQVIFDLVQAIGGGDVKAVLTQTDALLQSGLSLDTLIGALVDHLRNLLILRTCGDDSSLVEAPGVPLGDLSRQARQFEPALLVQDLAILEDLRRQARQSQAGRALLDATLARLAMADQFVSVADLMQRLSGPSAGSPSAPAAQKKKPEPVVETAADDDDDLPRPGKIWEGPKVSLGALLQQQSTAAPVPAVDAVHSSDRSGTWKAVLDLLAGQAGLVSLLSHARYIGIEEGRAIIRYDKAHETFVKMFERNGKKDVVRDTLSKVLRQNVGIKFEIEPEAASSEGPAAPPVVQAPPRLRPQSALVETPAAGSSLRLTPELLESLRADPLIKAVMEGLGASIVKVEEGP